MRRQCFHCKEWIDADEPHDCWTTTEAALTSDLSLELREAWERLRETAADFGEQRIYASHHSIMFARKACYFFVRPKRSYLEVCIFLGRPVNAPQVRQIVQSSKYKVAHLLRIRHRDEVEPPITDWIREAYDYNVEPRPARAAGEPSRAPVAVRKQAGASARTRKTVGSKNARATRPTTTASASAKKNKKTRERSSHR